MCYFIRVRIRQPHTDHRKVAGALTLLFCMLSSPEGMSVT